MGRRGWLLFGALAAVGAGVGCKVSLGDHKVYTFGST